MRRATNEGRLGAILASWNTVFSLFPTLTCQCSALFTGLPIPEQSVTKQRRNKTRNGHREVQDAGALCGKAEGSSGEDLEYTNGEKRSAGKSPAFLRQRNPHRRVMADGQAGKARGEAGQKTQRQDQNEQDRQIGEVFGEQHLPAPEWKEPVTYRSRFSVEAEEALRVRAERQSDQERQDGEGAGIRLPAQQAVTNTADAENQRYIRIEYREHLPEVVADQTAETPWESGHAAQQVPLRRSLCRLARQNGDALYCDGRYKDEQIRQSLLLCHK